MLHNFDLQKARIFSEVARTQSVLQSAQTVGVSPSAVSQSVKALERSLGRQLFVRVGKRLQPTPFATELAAKVKSFFGELAALIDQESSQLAPQEIRLGAPPLFGCGPFFEGLDRFRKRHPQAIIELTLADTRRLTEDLIQGRIELALLDISPSLRTFREIHTETLAEEELILCASREFHRAHLQKDASLRQLKTLPHLRYNHDKEAVYKWYTHHFGRMPELPVTAYIDHSMGLLNAVQRGWGLAVLPSTLVAPMLKEGSLVNVAGRKKALKNEILLAQLKGSIPSRARRALIKELREEN